MEEVPTNLLAVPSPWEELEITVDRPPGRGGHASAISPDGKFLFIFGGCDPFGVASNALYMISLFSSGSKKSKGQLCSFVADPKQQNVLPPKRSGHCLYCLPSIEKIENNNNENDDDIEGGKNIVRLLLFGGIDYLPSCRVFGDVWICEVDTSSATILSWKQLAHPSVTSKICRHSFASCLFVSSSSSSSSLLLFTCGGSDSLQPLAAPMMLDINKAIMSNSETKILLENSNNQNQSFWIPVADPENAFNPVEMVSACFLPSAKTILIAGGRTAEGKDEDSLYSVVAVANQTSSSQNSPFLLRRIAKSPSLQRTCASLTPLTGSCAMMIGGVSEDVQLSSLPLDVAIDVVSKEKTEKNATTGTILVDVTVSMIRPITRLESSSSAAEEIDLVGGVHFGIGQSLASCLVNVVGGDGGTTTTTTTRGEGGGVVVACVGGLFPNAVGHTAQIFVSTNVKKRELK